VARRGRVRRVHAGAGGLAPVRRVRVPQQLPPPGDRGRGAAHGRRRADRAAAPPPA
jgi:hypothetical protein